MLPATWPTPDPTPGAVPPSRAARTAVAVAVAASIGALGHVVAGAGVSVGALVAAVGVATVPAWLSSGRERGWAWIAALQIGNQQLVHVALTCATAAGTCEPAMLEPMPHDLMLAAHVVAGLVTALALRAGERRLWAGVRRVVSRMGQWWRRLADRTGTSLPRVASSPVVLPDGSRPLPHQRMLRHAVVLRGPPLPIT